MNRQLTFQLLADAVLVLHGAIALFVVAGLVLVVAGNWRRWQWVNRLGFRLAHLAAIGVVVAESWFGVACPLTTLELALRARAGASTYRGNFIEHWLQALLYYDAPERLFTALYVFWALATLVTLWLVPPRKKAA